MRKINSFAFTVVAASLLLASCRGVPTENEVIGESTSQNLVQNEEGSFVMTENVKPESTSQMSEEEVETEIFADNTSDDDSMENSSDVQIEPQEESISEYEKAFVNRGRECDIYHMFDVDNQTMIYFTTNESGVMEGTYSGDFSDGVTMTWEDGGETWTEKFIHREGSTKAIWVDHLGIEYPYYEVCDIATAQRALDKLLDTRAPVETVTTTGEVLESTTEPQEESSYITIDNNENFSELMKITDQTDSTTIKNLLKLIRKEGKIVEFDGCIGFLMQHENYKTRFDVLVVGGDYTAERVYGPLFSFENVSFFDMNVSGTDTVEGGMNFHIIAKIKGFNDEGNYVILDPIELKVR